MGDVARGIASGMGFAALARELGGMDRRSDAVRVVFTSVFAVLVVFVMWAVLVLYVTVSEKGVSALVVVCVSRAPVVGGLAEYVNTDGTCGPVETAEDDFDDEFAISVLSAVFPPDATSR